MDMVGWGRTVCGDLRRWGLLFLVPGFLLVTQLEGREFVSNDGRSIEAELVDVRADSAGVMVAEIRRSDRRYFVIPISNFSDADQRFFREFLEKKNEGSSLLHSDDRIDLNIKMNRREESKDASASAYTGSSSKDQKDLFRPEVILENEELTKSSTGNSMRIVVIARNESDKNEFLIASASTVDVDIPAKDTISVFGDPFFLRNYEYRSAYSHARSDYGFEIDDYAIILMNSDGEVTHTRISSKGLEDNMDNLMSCAAGEVYTKNLEYKTTITVSSSYYSKAER